MQSRRFEKIEIPEKEDSYSEKPKTENIVEKVKVSANTDAPKKILGMKPIYFYSGIAVVGFVAAYFLINKFTK
jgi:hypothetical protein